jgi:hypothetical protein
MIPMSITNNATAATTMMTIIAVVLTCVLSMRFSRDYSSWGSYPDKRLACISSNKMTSPVFELFGLGRNAPLRAEIPHCPHRTGLILAKIGMASGG